MVNQAEARAALDQSQAANYGVFANFIVIGDFLKMLMMLHVMAMANYLSIMMIIFGDHIFTEDSSGGFAAFAFVVRYVLQTMAAIEWIVFKSTLIQNFVIRSELSNQLCGL